MIDRKRLEAIVREAGAMALATWPGHGHALEQWEKSPNNPVCAADLAVDAFLKRELGVLLPSAGWLSEETVALVRIAAHWLSFAPLLMLAALPACRARAPWSACSCFRSRCRC